MKMESAKAQFLDKKAVEGEIGKRAASFAMRFGAFVRTNAISSMLGHKIKRGFGAKSKISNRQGVAPPGKPPFPHAGHLVRLIFFAYDPQAKAMVIGPLLFQSRGSADAMRVLQDGGTQTLKRPDGETVMATYQPRPFMLPALKDELAKIRSTWGLA